MRFISGLLALAISAPLVSALTSSLQQVTGFTAGPTAAKMYVYIPTTKVANPPIVVAIHYCQGTASGYFGATSYAQYADTYGYIVIFPNSPSSGGCWDVASTASLTHNGGGDSLTIVNMVKYAIANYGGDASRVYATGSSSGAMMTNVLAGAYPDVFKAGVVYAGVPDGCFYVAGATAGMATPGWNNACANGQSIQTAQAWGDLARSYYPGYTGARPKMQIYHGTADAILLYPNLGETLKQWSNVLGLSFSQNITNTPISGYTKIVYGDGSQLLGFSAQGVGHTPPVRVTDDLAWFGIPGSGSSSSTTTSKTSTTLSTVTTPPVSVTTPPVSSSTTVPPVSTSSSTAPPATTSATTTAAHWGQCGGQDWKGPTVCAPPYTCTYSNAWYSQVRHPSI